MSRRTNKIKPLLILWLATAMITVAILVFGVASFFSLNQADTKVFSPPSEEQIALFMQESKIQTISTDKVEYILVSQSPHKSDSRAFLMYAQDVSSVYQNKIEYVTPQQVDLTPDISFSFDSETVIDVFLRVYSSSTDNKTLYVLSNLSSTIIDQFTATNR